MTEQEFFTYKGLPLVRKDNTIYYGNMSDKYVAMLTVLSTHKVKDLEIADKTRVQLMSTDPKTPATEIIAKTSDPQKPLGAGGCGTPAYPKIAG